MRSLKARYFALIPLLLLPTLLVVLQLGPYLAYHRLLRLDFLSNAPPAEQRRAAHEALDYWFGDPHDAFVVLGQFGDASSIPVLRRAIANRPASERGDVMTCTWDHAFRALAKLEHHS